MSICVVSHFLLPDNTESWRKQYILVLWSIKCYFLSSLAVTKLMGNLSEVSYYKQWLGKMLGRSSHCQLQQAVIFLHNYHPRLQWEQSVHAQVNSCLVKNLWQIQNIIWAVASWLVIKLSIVLKSMIFYVGTKVRRSQFKLENWSEVRNASAPLYMTKFCSRNFSLLYFVRLSLLFYWRSL